MFGTYYRIVTCVSNSNIVVILYRECLKQIGEYKQNKRGSIGITYSCVGLHSRSRSQSQKREMLNSCHPPPYNDIKPIYTNQLLITFATLILKPHTFSSSAILGVHNHGDWYHMLRTFSSPPKCYFSAFSCTSYSKVLRFSIFQHHQGMFVCMYVSMCGVLVLLSSIYMYIISSRILPC